MADVDVVVVGGGIVGAGAAQALAAAGYRCLLAERWGWAHGTSSKSSKLIHGGLRYLETAQVALVRESLRERELLLALAPSLVRPLPFLIPVYEGMRRRPWQLYVGLGAYGLLAGWTRLARFGSYAGEDVDRLVGDTGLRREGLRRVFRYWDAQTDDARLTRAVVASATDLGAMAWCPAELRHAERVADGYRIRLQCAGEERTVVCRYLVNAAGAWSAEILSRIHPALPVPAADHVLGSHVEIRPRLAERAFYLESPRDGRAVFALPWKDRTLVGTTEHLYRGDPDAVRPPPGDVDYLLGVLRHYFPAFQPEVVARWAGLRVLPRGKGEAFRRPRDCVLHVDPRHPRLLSLAGGKLTGYRRLALRVVAQVQGQLGPRVAIADTASLPLVDPDGAPPA